MIREYAFDPRIAVADPNTLQRFFSEFGAGCGRVIGEVPSRWKDELVKKIQTMGLSQVARRKCLDQLEKLARSGIVSRGDRRLNNDNWLERALEQHAILPFNAILTDSENLDDDQFNYFNMLESSPNNWVIEHTKSVPRIANDLANSIDLSLKLSKVVLFVDPYFDPLDENHRSPFIEYTRRCRSGRIPTNRIFVHACEIGHQDLARRKSRADLVRGMNECIKPLLPAGLSVELWIWPFDKVHDRFVLTNLVGYAFGHGLSEAQYRNAINVNVNRLARSAHEEQFRFYSTQAHRIGDPIVVCGE